MRELIERLLAEPGEDPRREGLDKTPDRVEATLRFLTSGYHQDPKGILEGATFLEDHYDEMVLVKDVDFYSLCVPSKQIVNAVDGAKPARLVAPGDRLWTLDRGFMKQTPPDPIFRQGARRIHPQPQDSRPVQDSPPGRGVQPAAPGPGAAHHPDRPDAVRRPEAQGGVGVVVEAVHLCMLVRGVEKQNSKAVTSAMLGAFRDRAATRAEFLELIRTRSPLI